MEDKTPNPEVKRSVLLKKCESISRITPFLAKVTTNEGSEIYT